MLLAAPGFQIFFAIQTIRNRWQCKKITVSSLVKNKQILEAPLIIFLSVCLNHRIRRTRALNYRLRMPKVTFNQHRIRNMRATGAGALKGVLSWPVKHIFSSQTASCGCGIKWQNHTKMKHNTAYRGATFSASFENGKRC